MWSSTSTTFVGDKPPTPAVQDFYLGRGIRTNEHGTGRILREDGHYEVNEDVNRPGIWHRRSTQNDTILILISGVAIIPVMSIFPHMVHVKTYLARRALISFF